MSGRLGSATAPAVPAGRCRPWAPLPDELCEAFLFGGDDPTGDFGMEEHASMVRPATAEEQ
jgi:hypothetical protein